VSVEQPKKSLAGALSPVVHADFDASQKTEPNRNHSFFPKTEPKTTNINQREIVTTLQANRANSAWHHLW